MIDYLLIPFAVFGAVSFYLGLVSLAYYPLALAYPLWERRLLQRATRERFTPSISVLIPAYNEEKVIADSVASVLQSDYPDFQVIVINDGSTDNTEAVLRPFIDTGSIEYIAQDNRGKAAALNNGIARARGEIVCFTDADSLFDADTLRRATAYFVDPTIGAVGGNDTPLHPRGPIQKMLVITSHIGTGFVRRALSIAGVLPIIPGNLGLVRRDILNEIGGFRDVLGEDLELTWRLRRHGVRVVYGASACVRAECPHTVGGLWKQRVRWMRGYLKSMKLHRGLIGNPRYGAFGPFLLFNSMNMIGVPLMQALGVVLLPLALGTGRVSLHGWEWVSYFGWGFLLAAGITAILLDRRPRDLVYLPWAVLLVIFSYFYNAVVVYALWSEGRRRGADWHKLERRGAPVHIQRTRRAATAATVLLIVAAGGLGFWLGTRHEPPGAQTTEPLPLYPQKGATAVAVHFDAWRDWRRAYLSVLETPEARYLNQIGVSAGRADWTYFRWPGHEDWWSPTQGRTDGDMLESAVSALQARGYNVTAILDVFATRYLERHPDHAATDDHGERGKDTVCSTVLTEGPYGDHLVQAAAALARHTRADTIAITELFYDRYCYDDRCLLKFKQFSGRDDWPRTRTGRIDVMDPALGDWRSRQVAGIVKRLATAVHGEGKRLALDVKLSRGNITNNSRENGQDYRLLAPLVDEFIVWDYFGLVGRTPESSAGVAAYFDDEFGADRFMLSVGLWKQSRFLWMLREGFISAASLGRSLKSAQLGGSDRIWITPAKELTPEHWQAIADFVRNKEPGAKNP